MSWDTTQIMSLFVITIGMFFFGKEILLVPMHVHYYFCCSM